MDGQELDSLKQRLESADALDEALARDVAAMLAGRLEGKLSPDEAHSGLMTSAEGALNVVGHVFAGWAVSWDGHASPRRNTKWRCTLKETRGPDDDQIVGIGNAHSMRLALLAAVTHIQAMRAAGYR